MIDVPTDVEGAVEIRTEVRAPRPVGLSASTICEAFQLTAAERADQVALRTIGDALSITFGEYTGRVRRLAGGFHALGVRQGDTVGSMLTNRPKFHLLDTAAMHLGATPFSIYNTSSVDQIEFPLRVAGNRVMAAFLERARKAMEHVATVEHLIVVDAVVGEAILIEELERGTEAEPDEARRTGILQGPRARRRLASHRRRRAAR